MHPNMIAVAASRPASSSLRTSLGLRLGIASLLVGLPLIASAQQAPAAQGGVTEELIRLLIKHNAIPRQEAEELIRKMQAPGSATPATPATPAATSAPVAKPGDVRVVYVPADEKQKLQAEIQQNILDTVKAENWATPGAYPAWLERISLDGDLRLRYELDQFDKLNSPFFINYQAINAGQPFDVNATNQVLPPLLNTTEDRNMMRARARIGLNARISDGLTASFFFATGNNTSPRVDQSNAWHRFQQDDFPDRPGLSAISAQRVVVADCRSHAQSLAVDRAAVG